MNDNRYEDIIHLPHHQSDCRPKMSVRDRAAQFAPFAALVGYEQMVQETEVFFWWIDGECCRRMKRVV